jgi:hypothetical protein
MSRVKVAYNQVAVKELTAGELAIVLRENGGI